MAPYIPYTSAVQRQIQKSFTDFRTRSWSLFALISVMTSYCLILFFAAFDQRIRTNIPGLVILYTCDMIYLVDTSWRIKAFKKHKQRVKFTRKATVGMALSFVTDFISLLPLEVAVISVSFTPVFTPKYLQLFSVLRMNRILRIYRVSTYYSGRSKELRLNLYRKEVLGIVVCFFCFLIILIHGCASTWYRLNCTPVRERAGPTCKGGNDTNFYKYSHGAGALSHNHMDSIGWYVAALHWTVMSLRNSGTWYTPPEGAVDMLISTFVMLFGYMSSAVITMFLIYILSEMDLRRSIFFHEAYAVKSFVKHFDMAKSVAKFSDQCFNFMWMRKRGYSDNIMKALLPKGVQTDIAMCMIQPLVHVSQVLRLFSPDALQAISLDATMKHFFANEFLIRPNTLVRTCYFIISGKVEILSETDGVTPILLLAKGSLIGEINLAYPDVRKNGVKTRTPCDIIILNNSSVLKLLKRSPEIEEKISAIVKERVGWTKAQQVQERTKKVETTDETEDTKELETPSTPLAPEQDSAVQPTSAQAPPATPDSKSIAAASGKTKRSNDSAVMRSKIERYRNVRRATGTQFMSVLAWLSFLKDEQRSEDGKGGKGTQDSSAYEGLAHRWRNEASARMYSIDDLGNEPTFVREKFRWAVSSDSMINRVWEGIVIGVIYFHALVYPVELLVNKWEASFPIDVFVELVYWMDLFVRLFILVQPEEISSLPSVLSNLKRQLREFSILVDVIPVLPIHHIALASTFIESNRTYNMFRAHFHVKFLRISFMFKRFENDVRVRIFTIRFFKNSFYISMYIYWLAMIFYVIGCPTYPDCKAAGNDTWIYLANESQQYDFDINTHSPFLMSFFWAICTTYGIGINDIDLAETAIHSVGLLVGFSMLSYFYADLASTLSGALENAIHHQDNVIWLTRFLDEALIDLRLIDRVSRYLDTQWQALRGISSEANRSIGFITVSHSMYIELLVDYVADYLYRTHLFRHLDTDTMRKFCLASKLAVVAPNETIICHGDFIRRMYVIRRGFVQVYIGDGTSSAGVLTKGHSFGEINMLFGIPSQVTLKSLTYLELIIVDHLAFEKIVPSAKYFAEAVEVLKKSADGLQRYQRHFLALPARHKRRRTRPHQPLNMSVYKYRKAVKNSKGQIINLRKLKNDPYTREFNNVRCGRYLRYFFMPMTFLPKGQFIRAWELVRVIIIILTAIIVPLVEAFPSLKNEAEHYIYILDVLSLVDMFIRLHTAYHDMTNNELITHPLLTARNYLAGAFLIDLLASFPVYLLINYSLLHTQYETSVVSYFLRCNRLLLLYRLYGYYKYKDLNIVKGKNTWKMIKLLPLLVYQAHVMGCLLSVISCPASQRNPNPDPRCGVNTWIYRSSAPGKSPNALSDRDIYVISFYYMATTSMGCGFGDYYPYNQGERALFALVIYLYIFLRAYILANVVGSKCHMDYKFLSYQKQMSYLVGYLGRERLDYRLSSRIIRYYDYQWRRTHGIEPQKLFSNLFPSLRKEVAMDVFEDVLRQLPELKRVPPSFLRAICVFLTPIYFLRHDIIVQKDDVCDHIYFISRGKVLEWREAGEAYLQVGDYIGSMDVGIVRPVYKYTASAVTNVDIFGIRRKDYIRIVNFYPNIARKFVQRSPSIVAGELESEAESVTPRSTFQRSQSSFMSSQADILMVEHANKRRGSEKEVMRQSLSEMVALVVEEDKKDDKNYDEEYMYAASVLPESPIYRYLDISTFIAAVISTSVTCYQWTFRDVNYEYFAICYAMDIIYAVRISLSFRVSYFDDSGEIISDSSEIQNKYLSDLLGFALDFLSTFPGEIFVASFALQGKHSDELKLMWAQFRINRLLRLVHVWTYFQKKSNALTNNLVRTKLERLTCFTLLYFHFVACGLHGISTSDGSDANCTVPSTPGVNKRRWACVIPEHWYQTKESIEGFEEHPYQWSLYFILSAFTTTAYGDLLAVDYFEKILISFITFSSLIWFGLVLSDMLSGLQNTVDTSYHLAADVVLKMYSDYGVTSKVLDKVLQHFTYAWMQNKGVLVPEFLTRAPACLKMDICTVTYGGHFRTSYLFRNLPEEFIRQATIRLHHMWVLAGDYVVRQNEIDSNLYFIHRGYVEYTKESSEVQGSVTEIGYLGRSAFFGEFQCIVEPEPHEYSFRAQVNLDIMSLTPGDMQELFELFPQHKTTILRRLHGKRKGRMAAESRKDFFSLEEQKRLRAEWDKLLLHDMIDDTDFQDDESAIAVKTARNKAK